MQNWDGATGMHGHQRHVGAPKFIQIEWLGNIVYATPLILTSPTGLEDNMVSVTGTIIDPYPLFSDVCFLSFTKPLKQYFSSPLSCAGKKDKTHSIKCIVVFYHDEFDNCSLYP